MNRWRLPSVLVLLLCLAAAPGWGQNVLMQSRGDRTALAPGIEMTDYERATLQGRLEMQLLRVDLARRESTLEAVLPPRGVWSAGRLAEMAAGVPDAQAVLALELEAGLTDPPWLEGLLFAGGELLGWPPAGPVAAILPEGAVRIIEPEDWRAAVVTTGGARVPLASINGAPAKDALALYGGIFNGNSVAGASWPAGTLAVPIQPAPGNDAPAISIWNAGVDSAKRNWLMGAPVPIGQISVGRDRWALVVPPGLSPEDRQALMTARTLTFDVELGSAAALSVLTLQAESVLLRDGELAGPEGEPAIRTALATDRSGSWVLLAQAGTTGRSQVAVTRKELAEFLAQRGATEAVELAADRRRMIADLDNDEWVGELGQLSVRAALVAVSRGPALAAAGGQTLRPIAVGAVRGSNEGAPHNGPGALVDGKAAQQRNLEQFWAAGAATGHLTISDAGRDGEWAELQLYQPAAVRAIDLVHVENCGFSPRFNLKGFRLLGRANATCRWKELAVVRHDEPVSRERFAIDAGERIGEIRIEVLEPSVVTNGPTARLAEIGVWGD